MEKTSKTRVKILTSIAGLGDPKTVEVLDAEYAKLRAQLSAKTRKPAPLSDAKIDEIIARQKPLDRYGKKGMGFARDWVFRPDQEALIPPALAEPWQEAGICIILPAAVAA
jgi:hypothetical protein